MDELIRTHTRQVLIDFVLDIINSDEFTTEEKVRINDFTFNYLKNGKTNK